MAVKGWAVEYEIDGVEYEGFTYSKSVKDKLEATDRFAVFGEKIQHKTWWNSYGKPGMPGEQFEIEGTGNPTTKHCQYISCTY
jgi:hypothetical protein